MGEHTTAQAVLRMWAMIPPSGKICAGWITHTRKDARAIQRREYPGPNRGARVVPIRVIVEARP
jgi:hypothetical protein